MGTLRFKDTLFELGHIFNFRGSDCVFCIFTELVVLIQRNPAFRIEALAYLVSELVTCLDAVCFPLCLTVHKSSNLDTKIKSKPVCGCSVATLKY